MVPLRTAILVLLSGMGCLPAPDTLSTDTSGTGTGGEGGDEGGGDEGGGSGDDTGCESQTWYTDVDGDGFGDPEDFVEDCERPGGSVSRDGDCDDTDDEINPDALDLCGDDIDDDCQNGPATCGPEGEFTLDGDNAAWTLMSTHAAGELGQSVAFIDVDQDEEFEVVVGALGEGAIYWFDMVPEGPSLDTDAHGTVEYVDASFYSQFGRALTGIEGTPIVAVGAPYVETAYSGGGSVYLFDGLSEGAWDTTYSEAQILSSGADQFVGAALVDMGEFDRTPGPDLMVGASPLGVGVAGVLPAEGTGTMYLDQADAYWTSDTDDQAGASMANGGDIDGDGLNDALIGAYNARSEGDSTGAAYIILGPGTHLSSFSDADRVLPGQDSYQALGLGLAGAGDQNDDGYSDIAIGVPGIQSVYVLEGNGKGNLVSQAAVLSSSDYESNFGQRILEAGDVDADGVPDLVVGSPLADAEAGVAWLFYGPLEGNLEAEDDAGARFAPQHGPGNFSYGLAGHQDIDGDGGDDLLIASPTLLNPEGGEGALWMVSSGLR